jgi:hypothetical protein
MWRHSRPQTEAKPRAVSAEWTWGPADALIAALLVAATVAVCVPVSFRLHTRARDLDREVQEAHGRMAQLRATLEHVEGRRDELARLRREVNRYVADVEARPIIPWSTVVTELSQRRPGGLRTTRISGNGPQFRAQLTAAVPELIPAYARALRESPFVDFATLPTGETPGHSGQVVGRLMGE